MRSRQFAYWGGLLLIALSQTASADPNQTLEPGEIPSHSRWIRQSCVRPKDFTIVKIGGYYHVYAIKSDLTVSSENSFLHQRSLGNPQTWEVLPDETLSSPPRTGWDASHIWAPSIVERNGTDYMFYTGVSSSSVQAIGLQTATNLALPNPWSASGISNPLLPTPGTPFVAASKQLRDPFVFRNPNGNNWLMLYTSSRSATLDHEGIGVAASGPDSSGDPLPGSWPPVSELVTDSTVYGAPDPARGGDFKTESSHFFQHGTRSYVLFSGDCDPNETTYGPCRGLAGGNIRILVNEDPALPTNGWQYKGTLSKLLGFNSSLWYASEYVKDPDTGEEYLATVRQSDQNDTCPGGSADTSVIELHRILWGVDAANPWKFGLADPNPPGFWTQQNVGGPGAREQAGVALDTKRHLLWYVGGYDGSTKNDVYTFPLTLTPSWSVRTPGSGPSLPSRRNPGLVYDPVGDRLIVYGGFATTSILNPMTDLWQLTGLGGATQWAAIAPDSVSSAPSNLVYGSQTVFDPVRHRMIVVDGQGRAWALNLPTSGNPYWQVLQASGGLINAGGLYFNLVYDSKHDRLLAFGGWLASFYPPYDSMNGVYAFPLSGANANTWVAITTTGTPPTRRSLAAAVYDARRDRLVVFGGQAPGDGSGTVYANEWQLSYGNNAYTGTWTQLSAPGTGPSARGGAVAAYDSTEDRMVCFGGRTGSSAWSGETWSSSWGAGAP